MTNGFVWLNGQLLPRQQAQVDALSQGFLYGAGIYDSLLLRHGAPVAFGKHLSRLTDGSRRLNLPPPDGNVLRAAIHALGTANGLTEARIRITLAAGASATIHSGPADEVITLLTAATLSAPKASAALMTTPFRRNEFSPLSGVKYTACAETLIAQRAALAGGCDEALFLNTSGKLCEGAFSNVFLVHHGIVLTPPLSSGCLAGVTRAVVLELCGAHSIPSREEDLLAPALDTADEVFLTSSIRGIQAVHAVNARTFPSPGALTQTLIAHYAAWLEAETGLTHERCAKP